MRATTPDLLEAIVAATRKSVESRRLREPGAALEARSQRTPQGAAFHSALARANRVNVIAECKRRSPSRGVLRAEYEPASIACGYERAGAVALSVLTEPTFFDGSLAHLEAVRAAVRLPLLRKDFIVDEYQLFEAIAAGADAVLLIVAALNDRQLRDLIVEATAQGLGTLVEAHDAAELQRAIDAGATLVGVNCRDLRTLKVDPVLFEAVAREWPAGTVAVAEVGIKSSADASKMAPLGYRGFLIGERFLTAADPGAALESFLAGTAEAAR